MKSQIFELGKQLGLSTEQIQSLMDDSLNDDEPVALSLGPPFYPGAHYGTVSLIDFDDEREMNKRNGFRITELRRQLGVPTEQLQALMSSSSQDAEPVSLSLGPPHYPGSFYGTVSIADFFS